MRNLKSVSLAIMLAAIVSVPVAVWANPVELHANVLGAEATAAEGGPYETSDTKSLAEMQGISEQEAEKVLAEQAAFGELTSVLRAKFPEAFADAWSEVAADGRVSRHVAVVGDVDSAFRDIVLASAVPVELHTGYLASESSLNERANRLAVTLHDGLPEDASFSVGFESSDGTLHVTLPARFRDQEVVQKVLEMKDVRATFMERDQVAATHTTVRGGGKMMKNGSLWCTAGFTVGTAGVAQVGIATAGHCRGLDNYNGPAGNSAAITFQQRHQGAHGDVEWFTTPNDPETKEFYADFGTDIRGVSSVVGEGAFNQGDFYCGFGRTTGKVCANIRRVSISCNYPTPDGLVQDLIQMDAVTHTGGDSGGPWFNGYVAAGMDSGECPWDGAVGETWSKANQLQEAMGVHVLQN